MDRKPTYEELAQRVRELEKQVADHREAERVIWEGRKIIDSMVDGVIVFDLGYRVVSANQAWMRMFGLKENDIIGKNVMEIPGIEKQKQEVLKTFFPLLKEAIVKGSSGPFELIITTQDDRNIPVSIAGGTTRTAKDNPNLIVAVVRDISKRKQAEEELKESEEKYRLIAETAIEGVYQVDSAGNFVLTNEAYEKMFGYERGELMGKHYTKVIPESKLSEAAKIVEAAVSGKPQKGEFVMKHKLGHEFPGYFSMVARTKKGKVDGFTGILEDITERKQADKALRESEERLQSIIDNTTAVIYLKDIHGKYILINSQYETLFHISKDQIIGKTDYDIFPKEMSDAFRENDLKVLEVGKPLEFEEIVLHDDGIHTYISIKFPLCDSSGVPYGVCGISTNITERKKAEKQIHTLTQELIAAQENERKRFSRELHDHVAQDLSASRIVCGLLLDNHPEAGPEIRQKISGISNALHASIMAVRDLAYDLQPPGLEELGLINSVYQYCEDFSEKSGIDIDFLCTGVDSLRLSLDAEIHIFRLIQEGFRNIWRHAHAGHATIRLVGAFPNIVLRIEDDGKGFDVEKRLLAAMDEKRMGLRNMEERVPLLQGQMKVHSKPGVGTIISIKFPYKEIRDDSQEDRIYP